MGFDELQAHFLVELEVCCTAGSSCNDILNRGDAVDEEYAENDDHDECVADHAEELHWVSDVVGPLSMQ